MVHDLFESDAFGTMADILSEAPPRVVLDVGAHVGSSCDRILERFPTSRVCAFEPVSGTFDRLLKRLGACSRVEAHRLAVGNRSGEIEIIVNELADTSSALAPSGVCQRYHGDKVREIHREQAEIIRLDDWAERTGVGPIEAIKIDVQGLELETLRGAEGLLRSSIKAVISEAQLAPMYVGAATFSEIDLFLRSLGFVLHQICRIASCGAEQRTTCCDALWVRTDVHQSYVERITRESTAPTGATT